MNKKINYIILSALLVFNSTVLMANSNIAITYLGKTLNMANSPITKDERVLLPLRELSEHFGYTVNWNSKLKEITIINGNNCITLYLNTKEALVNTNKLTMDIAPYSANDKIYVPIRFISEAFNLSVDWNSKNRQINIQTKGYTVNTVTKKLLCNLNGKSIELGDVLINHSGNLDIIEQKISDNSSIIRVDNSHGEPAMVFDVSLFYIKNHKVIKNVSYMTWYPRNREIQCLDNKVGICDGKKVYIYDDITGTLINEINLISMIQNGTYTLDIIGDNFIVVREEANEGGGMAILVDLTTQKIQKLYELIPNAEDKDYLQANSPTFDGIRLKEKSGDTLIFTYHSADGKTKLLSYTLN